MIDNEQMWRHTTSNIVPKLRPISPMRNWLLSRLLIKASSSPTIQTVATKSSVTRFGKIFTTWAKFEAFGYSLSNYLVIGKMLNLLWEFFMLLAKFPLL